MKIGVLPAVGSGYTTMARTGQAGRLERYFRWYEQLGEVRYFSYLQESLDHRIWSKNHFHWSMKQYAILLPFIQPALRTCSVLRCMNLLAAVPAIVARIFFGIPFVVSHGADYEAIAAIHGDHRQIRKWRWLRRVAFKLAAAVLVPSQPMAERFRVEYPYANIRWQPNWVDCKLFQPFGVPFENRTFAIYVGRLVREKNLPVAAAIAKSCGTFLVCYGEGPERPHIERAGGLCEGMANWTALPALLAPARFFVLPSFSEGHPKALIEAMACGLPVAVSDRIEGVVTHMVHGVRFDPEDLKETEQAFRLLLGNDNLAQKFGEAGRWEVLAQYDEQVLMPRELALLQEVAR